MPDEKTLDDRTDADGHVTPSQNDAQRAADIDEQVRRAREGETSVGGNTVEPGAYGPDSIARETVIYPADDGQTDAEATARSEAIDAQVEAARSGGAVGMQTGVATAGPSQEGAVAAVKADSAGDLHDLTIPELKALAEARGVDLQGVTKKDDIVAALENAGK